MYQRMLRKSVATLLALVLLWVPVTTVSASRETQSVYQTPTQSMPPQARKPGKIDWNVVIERYGLESATSVPSGIVPLKFESPEQLDEFLSRLSSKQKEPPHIVYRDSLSKKLMTTVVPSTSTDSYVVTSVVTRSCSQNIGWMSTFHTWADISVSYSGSFRWINGVLNTRTGLTGLTTGFHLHDTYSYAYDQSAVSVSVKGGGIITVYLLIDGGVQIFSSPVSCSFTYSVY